MILANHQEATFLTNNFGDRYLYDINHNSLNKVGAEHTHERRFGELIGKENTLLIIIGTDSGTLITYLNRAKIASGTRIILIELDDYYEKIDKAITTAPNSSQVIYTQYKHIEEIFKKIQIQQYVYIDNIHLAQSLGAEDAFLPEYQELFYTLQAKLQRLSWEVEGSLGSEPFLIEQLKNMGENIVPSTCLKGLFPGKTAILLAGGPSLDGILPWVKENQEKFVTIAVSRVCRRLYQVGFTPDIIFSIDPHQVSFDVSKEMLLFWKDSLFVHMYHVTSLLLGQWRGKSIYLGNRVPWQSDFNQESLPHPGPTVSNVALATAIEMGFSQIVLAGVDLCLSKTGFTHAEGSDEFSAGPQLGKICSQVETNDGGLAETTSDFATAIDILNEQAKNAKKKNVKLINPATGAARIEHIDFISSSDINIEPLHKNARIILNKAVPIISPKLKQNHYNECIKELVMAQGKLQHIKKLCQEAIHCNEGLFGRNGRRKNFKHKKRMDKIENSLNRKHKQFSRLVKIFGIREFLKTTHVDIDRNKEWEDEEIENTARAYYDAYRNSTTALIQLIRDSKTRIQSRLDELDPPTNFQSLANQWKNDKQPGRALLWLEGGHLQLSTLSEKNQETWLELSNNYDLILHDTATHHMEISKEFATLKGVRGKIYSFFKQKNRESLQQLTIALKKHPDPEADQYGCLSQGLFYELEEDLDKATDEYQKLFTNLDSLLLEDALKRIASISITKKDFDNVLLAFESLSQISPSYFVQYADLLRLRGFHQEATANYLNYLEYANEDTTLMIKIGQYYRELNIEEGAQAMFHHVLKLDPQNKTAQKLLTQTN